MKIALIGPVYPYRGGIAHYTTMLYHALSERQHDVLLISFKRQYPRWLFPGRSDRDPSEVPLRVNNAQYWLDPMTPWSWLLTFQRIRRYNPDILILQWWTTFWAPVWVAIGVLNHLFLHKPLIYICHNVLPHEARWWDPWIAKVVLRQGSYFIVQSEAEKQRLLTLVSDAPVEIVPHPVYDMFANKRIPREEARRKLKLPLQAPVLLFFGIVREYKGLKDLLAAMPEIQHNLGYVVLLVAGEFWGDKQPYLEIIKELNLTDSVIIEDRYIPNEEVPLYFSAADVLVAPYRWVTGSGAIQMARGFNVPVITTTEKENLAGNKNAIAQAVTRFFTKTANRQTPQGQGKSPDLCSWNDLAERIERGIRGPNRSYEE